MPRNVLLGIGLLTAVALILMLALKGGLAPAAEPEAALAASSDEGSHSTHEKNAELLRSDSPISAERGERASEAPATERHREEATLGAATGDAVRLVNESDQLLRGAEVWVIHDADEVAREAFTNMEHIDAFMIEHAQLHTSSNDGLVHLPTSRTGRTLVVARKGVLWGRLAVEAEEHNEDHLSLVLEPDVLLHVTVLRGAAQPVVGITVNLERADTRWSNVEQRRVTRSPDGRATFTHLQASVPALLHGVDGADEPRWRVAPEALLLEPVRRELTPDVLQAGQVTLTIPATGSVEVAVLDERWEPLEGAATAQLEAIPEGEPREISPFSSIKRDSIEAPVKDSKARFSFIELGAEVGVRVTRRQALVGTRAYGAGPTRLDETAQLEVKLGSDHPVVRVRALDEAGAPLRNRKLAGEVALQFEFINTQNEISPRTDEHGYCLIDLNRDWSEGSTRVVTLTDKQREAPQITGTLDLSYQLELGINEQGDLTLGPPPIFAAGRVVSQEGQALANAELALRTKGESSYSWDQDRSFHARTDAKGYFEVEGTIVGHEFQLAAEVEGHACSWTGFERGERDIVIVMPLHGRIEGRVLLDERIPYELIHVNAEAPSEGEEHVDYSERSKTPEDDGSFSFERLMPGKRRVTVRARSQSGELASIEDVEIRSGEVCRDPRLAEIDLRGRLFLHELELLGVEPEANLSGSLRFGPAGAETLEGNTWLHDRTVEILSQDERIDVDLNVAGYRPEQLRGIGGKAEVTLRKGLTVTLVLTGAAQVPDPPLFIKAILVPLSGNHDNLDWSGGSFDERREIKARCPQGGQMKVEWVIERRSSNSSVATSHSPEREILIEVLDTDAPQSFELELSEAEMAEIVGVLN